MTEPDPWGTPERPAVCECDWTWHAGKPCRNPPVFPAGVITTPALCMHCQNTCEVQRAAAPPQPMQAGLRLTVQPAEPSQLFARASGGNVGEVA